MIDILIFLGMILLFVAMIVGIPFCIFILLLVMTLIKTAIVDYVMQKWEKEND